MKIVNVPDAWIVVKIHHKELKNPLYKLVAGWGSGFTKSSHDMWHVNGGITGVKKLHDWFLFQGACGKSYTCHEKRYELIRCTKEGLDRVKYSIHI
jgi:hypothetical protein